MQRGRRGGRRRRRVQLLRQRRGGTDSVAGVLQLRLGQLRGQRQVLLRQAAAPAQHIRRAQKSRVRGVRVERVARRLAGHRVEEERATDAVAATARRVVARGHRQRRRQMRHRTVQEHRVPADDAPGGLSGRRRLGSRAGGRRFVVVAVFVVVRGHRVLVVVRGAQTPAATVARRQTPSPPVRFERFGQLSRHRLRPVRGHRRRGRTAKVARLRRRQTESPPSRLRALRRRPSTRRRRFVCPEQAVLQLRSGAHDRLPSAVRRPRATARARATYEAGRQATFRPRRWRR